MRVLVALGTALATALTALQPLIATQYSITDLGIDGENVAWVGVNNAGQIVINLQLQLNADTNRLFLISGGTENELPTLGGRLHGLGAPNDLGVMIGSSETPDGQRHAVYYANGILQDWGALGEIGSSLVGTNDAGTIIGNNWNRLSTDAVIFNGPSDVTPLGTLGGNTSSAAAINNLNQITGTSTTGAPYLPGQTTTPAQEGFLYENGHMTGIGTLGGHTSNGYDINDGGQIVGDSSLPNGEMHAFIWDSANGMKDLGTPGFQSIATLIDNRGLILGVAETVEGYHLATIFDKQQGPQFLQDLIPPNSGWDRLNYATDINDLGWIVGTGTFQGQNRAFLLTPIPEPSSLAMFLLTCASMITIRSNRNACD